MKIMAAKNLNEVSKLIVPLLDDNIVHDDISLESGFINAFTTDIDRPYLENYIFLLYKTVNSLQSLNMFCKFSDLDTVYNVQYFTINKEHYSLYTFTRTNSNNDIKNLLNGSGCISVQSKLNIYNFWKDVPSESYNYELFLPQFKFGTILNRITPERDYCHYKQEMPDN